MSLDLRSITDKFARELSRAIERYVERAVKGGGGGRVVRGGNGRGGRRSSRQIAGEVERVLVFIKKNPGLRTEEIMEKLGGSAGIKDALARLRSTKRVKTKGIKRAMTYSV